MLKIKTKAGSFGIKPVSKLLLLCKNAYWHGDAVNIILQITMVEDQNLPTDIVGCF